MVSRRGQESFKDRDAWSVGCVSHAAGVFHTAFLHNPWIEIQTNTDTSREFTVFYYVIHTVVLFNIIVQTSLFPDLA